MPKIKDSSIGILVQFTLLHYLKQESFFLNFVGNATSFGQSFQQDSQYNSVACCCTSLSTFPAAITHRTGNLSCVNRVAVNYITMSNYHYTTDKHQQQQR